MTVLLASLVLHIGVAVTCAPVLPITGTAGVYDASHPAIILRSDVCARLDLLRTGARPSSLYSQRDFSEALWVTGHEWARSQGINAEPASDCAGIPRMVAVGRWLGVGRGYVSALQGYAVAALMHEGCS